MIFGIGLPRCAGQSLQQAISILTGKRCWHSLGRNWDALDPETDAGAVEVWQPISWLEEKFPESKYILNVREDLNSWISSCERVYQKSINYNNPLWQNPLNAFPNYRKDYEYERMEYPEISPLKILVWDFVENPHWGRLCRFLGVDEPSQPFPNVDIHGRPQQPQDGLNQTNFKFDFGIGY